jgi:hypothetical protein
MREIKLFVNKKITRKKFPFAKFDFCKEESVYLHYDPTHNNRYNNGLLCSIDNQAPYFEIPPPYLSLIDNNQSYKIFITESYQGTFKLYGKTKGNKVIIMIITEFEVTKEYSTIDELEPPF